jgi:hypothetical protein
VNGLFAVRGIPKSFVYDRDGKLVAQSIDMRTQKQFLLMLEQAGLKCGLPVIAASKNRKYGAGGWRTRADLVSESLGPVRMTLLFDLFLGRKLTPRCLSSPFNIPMTLA